MPAARWFLLSSDPGRLWPRPRDGRLQQEKISPWLARIESDDRMTLCGEGETFRLAIQIPKLPHIKELRSATTRREIVKARNGGGLVTQQIERPLSNPIPAVKPQTSVVGGQTDEELIRISRCWSTFSDSNRSFPTY